MKTFPNFLSVAKKPSPLGLIMGIEGRAGKESGTLKSG